MLVIEAPSFWRKSAVAVRVHLEEVASAAEESQTGVFGRMALKKIRMPKLRGKDWTPLCGVHSTAGSELEKLSAGGLEFALDFSLFQICLKFSRHRKRKLPFAELPSNFPK